MPYMWFEVQTYRTHSFVMQYLYTTMFPLRLIFTAFCNTLFCVTDNGIDGEALVALTESAVEILTKK